MPRLLRWINQHRVALGYVIVACVFTVLALAVLELLPLGIAELDRHGYEMEEPGWLVLLAAIPLLWFVRLHSLTDVPLLQQLASALVRSAILVVLSLGLARISHVGHEARKVTTVVVIEDSGRRPGPSWLASPPISP